MVGIYKIQSPSNDVYIGQSRNISIYYIKNGKTWGSVTKYLNK